MKQTSFTLLLAVLLGMVGLQAFAAFGTTKYKVGGVYYYLDYDNLQAEVTNKSDVKYTGDIVIPSNITSYEKTYTVTSIGGYAFFGCTGLTSITIPNTVTSIGGNAFYDCTGLTSITIPNSVTSIGGNAFEYCTGLTSITIPNSVTIIGGYAFYGCTGLTSVTIPNSVTSIGRNAFDNCKGLTSITIPNSVTSIGNGAFWGCSGLTSVTIPESVDSIGRVAFGDIVGLTSITIPESVDSIGVYAFSGCSGLTSIVVESGNTKYDSRNNCNAIIHTTSNTLVAGCMNTIIPESVDSIYIGAFWGCRSLTSVTIPDGVTSIGYQAFVYCSGLTSVIIPNSVTSIDDRAFGGCEKLEDFYLYAEQLPSASEGVFDGEKMPNATLHVPANVLSVYQTTAPWKDFGTIVALTDDDPKPTGIADVKRGKSDVRGAYYDLNGRRLNVEPTQGGVYVHQGRKVVVR